jgi:uncharacterized protein (TIGR03067 family)
MKRHLSYFMVLVVLSAIACSKSRTPDAATSVSARDLAREELEQLQGTWRIESSVWNGVPESDPGLSITLLVQGDKLIWLDRDGSRAFEDTIKLMPDQHPKAIDTWSKGRDQAAPGIYSLEGDTFKWCSAGGNNKVRPTSFASDRGSKQSLMIFQRKKS